MNKIYKLLFLSIFIMAFSSCDNEDMEQLTIAPSGSGEITAPQTGSAYILNPEENQLNTILTLTWNPADYGVPTEISYKIEFAMAGTNFAEPFLAGATTNTYQSWTIGEFNGAAVTAGLAPFVEGELDIRITSSVGSLSSSPQLSDVITIKVTPFTTALPKIAVPGNHQGWDPPTAPLMAASGFGETDYEGYMWLDGGYKFVAPDQTGAFSWNNVDWGDDGTFTGVLIADGESDCTAVAGFYYVEADTNALTYEATAVSWAITGAATPLGWPAGPDGTSGQDTDLIYDPVTKTLSVDIDLTPGPFKFRGNDRWGQFDLGTVDEDGHLQGGGDLTFDGPAGNYHVVLDLSDPRAYTYSVTAN